MDPYFSVASHLDKRDQVNHNTNNRQWRFFWRKAGRQVSFASVHHPGMAGKRYLTRPLAIYGLRHGARVLIHPH